MHTDENSLTCPLNRYPVNESMLASDVTYLSYQTLTIDLYAPLLMLILLFSLMYTLMSCSCSRISDRSVTKF